MVPTHEDFMLPVPSQLRLAIAHNVTVLTRVCESVTPINAPFGITLATPQVSRLCNERCRMILSRWGNGVNESLWLADWPTRDATRTRQATGTASCFLVSPTPRHINTAAIPSRRNPTLTARHSPALIIISHRCITTIITNHGPYCSRSAPGLARQPSGAALILPHRAVAALRAQWRFDSRRFARHYYLHHQSLATATGHLR